MVMATSLSAPSHRPDPLSDPPTASPGKLAVMPRASMIDVPCSSCSDMAKIVLLSSWPCPALAHRHAEGGGVCDHSSHKPTLPISVLSSAAGFKPAGPRAEGCHKSVGGLCPESRSSLTTRALPLTALAQHGPQILPIPVSM